MATLKPTKKERNRIGVIIRQWKLNLYLQAWNIEVIYDMTEQSRPEGDCLAEIDANPTYMTAKMTIYLGWFSRDEHTQEMAIIHELCHCLTQDYKNALRDAHNGHSMSPHLQSQLNERLTQLITCIAHRPL